MKKKFIGTYLIALLIMLCVFVPYNIMKTSINESTKVEHFLFDYKLGYDPAWFSFSNNGSIAVIDYKLLAIQAVIITMVFAIIYLFLPNRKIKAK